MLDMYLLTLAISLALAIAVTLGLQAVSRSRKFETLFHIRGITERPRWGGVVFLATFALTPFIASLISTRANEFFTPKSGSFLGFLAAAAVVFLVGFVDDVRLTSPWTRTVVFFGAAVAVYAAGYRIDDIGLPWGPSLHFGAFGIVLTILWIYATTNAFNFIDGRDGVALGVAILAAVTIAQIGAHSAHPTVALLLVALAGAGLGFLPFNLPPASMYIGDSGAYVLGFVIGTLSIRATTGPTDEVFIAVPLVALGFPIMDLALATVRRSLDRRHPMIGDGDHIHRRLEEAGAGPRGIVAIVYMLAVLFSAGAITLHYVQNTWIELVVFLGVLATVSGTLLRLGYVVTIWNSHSIVWLRQHVYVLADNVRRGA